MLDWTPVKSSNIGAVRYFSDKKVLQIRFLNGNVYEYSNVDQGVADALVSAPSVGSAFHTLIKSKPQDYPFRRVDG